ncbi:MAG: hypothetical protein O6952_04490, partial [Planctomycetota bacterium]|nr:hypothetical protein [Planctomycetota bacterium]
MRRGPAFGFSRPVLLSMLLLLPVFSGGCGYAAIAIILASRPSGGGGSNPSAPVATIEAPVRQ